MTGGLRTVDNHGMSGHPELPEILLTSATGPVSVPTWVRDFPHETRRAPAFRTLVRLPAMTIVQAEDAAAVLTHRVFLVKLASLHAHQSTARIVFAFRKSPRQPPEARVRLFTELLRYFVRVSDIELAHGRDGARLAVEEAMAKLLAEVEVARLPSAPAPQPADPLAGVRKVLEATASLRSEAARLHAGRIAGMFGLSVAELAGLLGRTRQAVSQTPDAESLQPSLRPFERIARLRSVLSESDFRSWLNLANPHLENRTPLEIVRGGRADAVANLAEDMLTGAPA